MDGAHDLGGWEGFGAVVTAGSDRSHTAGWELRVQALALLASGESLRPFIEGLAPDEYLAHTYFERWLLGAEQVHLERGRLSRAELDRWRDILAENPRRLPARSDPAAVAAVDEAMTTTGVLPPAEHPRFAVGDRVRVRRMHYSTGPCRCPRYVRGACGVVERLCGGEPPLDLPGHPPLPVYTVAFHSPDLWGPQPGEPAFQVHVDLSEHFLAGAADD